MSIEMMVQITQIFLNIIKVRAFNAKTLKSNNLREENLLQIPLDELALSGIAYGSDGLIGSFYNVIPELFIGLYNAYKRGDWEQAQCLQKQADAIIFCVLKYPMHASMKRMLSWIGCDAGTVRSPFSSLDEEAEKQLKKELRIIRDAYSIKDVAVLEAL